MQWFFAWLVLSTTLLFSAPFCVHMALCGDVYTAKHSMYDSFLLISNANRLCSAMQTDLLLDSGVSAFSTMTLQQTGPLVPHPPPNLRFLNNDCSKLARLFLTPHPTSDFSTMTAANWPACSSPPTQPQISQQ